MDTEPIVVQVFTPRGIKTLRFYWNTLYEDIGRAIAEARFGGTSDEDQGRSASADAASLER